MNHGKNIHVYRQSRYPEKDTNNAYGTRTKRQHLSCICGPGIESIENALQETPDAFTPRKGDKNNNRAVWTIDREGKRGETV